MLGYLSDKWMSRQWKWLAEEVVEWSDLLFQKYIMNILSVSQARLMWGDSFLKNMQINIGDVHIMTCEDYLNPGILVVAFYAALINWISSSLCGTRNRLLSQSSKCRGQSYGE
ncbi:unnamed protein product [Amoebophrya sp. A25]|nr:unnamed protein product [Amoebophrya sp. A25]|eukprot:GSA25T00017987001.1